jgi:Spy/CpxP family protein refolding chaperone
LFASRTVTGESLAAALQSIGATRTALRAAHLKAHLATTAILTPEQVARHSELRGYASGHQPASPAPDHHR